MAAVRGESTIAGRILETLKEGPGFLPDLKTEPLLADLPLPKLSTHLIYLVKCKRVVRVRVETDVDVYGRKHLWLYGLPGQL